MMLDRLAARIAADYAAVTPASLAMFHRAAKVLPGGVSGNLRYFAPHPLYMRGGEGARTFDLDGRALIDCFLCNGPLLLGHRDPAIVEAIAKAAEIGPLVLNPEVLAECAEAFCNTVPAAERVRFLNSGTEALTAAVRYARGYTRRTKIIKFFGHYHGQDDQFLVGASPRREPFSNGIPGNAYADTLTLSINDPAALQAAIAAHPGEIAAVVLDAAMHSGGLWGVDGPFLHWLREFTRAEGIVLILDEVITGFRLAPGGAQELYGIRPDLCTFAKALGAGERLAAVGGSAEVMQVVDPLARDPARRVFQSGTGNDSTAGLLAATAAMRVYRQLGAAGRYAELDALGAALAAGLVAAFSQQGLPLHVNQRGAMLQLFLSGHDPDFVRFYDLDQRLIDLFYLALISRGIVLSLPTSNHIYLSFKHTAEDIAEIVDAARAVLAAYPFAEAYRELGASHV